MNIFESKIGVSFGFEADVVVALGLKEEINLLAATLPPRFSAILFALILPRAERASTFDISAERNVWLQSALRSFTIVCDYMETAFFEIVCDRLRSYGNQPLDIIHVINFYIRDTQQIYTTTVEPRLSGLVGTSVKSPDNRESG